MEWDTTLRTLYRLAERVEGEDLVRVREAIAKRRSELALSDLPPGLLADTVAASREPVAPPAQRPFTPAGPDGVPRLVRRPGERKYRVAPRESA